MLLTAYCLSYGNWTVIPRQWHETFIDMKNCGFDAVALSFSESEMMYSRRTFEMQITMAHNCGLKVIAIPSRLGGRLAGAPFMASMWLSQNRHVELPECPGIACVESLDFQQWIKQFITTLVSDYDIDGIIWDEPKKFDFVTQHPETITMLGNNPAPENMADSFAELLQELSLIAKDIKPDMSITIFNMPLTRSYFSTKITKAKGIDYAGFDGNFSRQSFFHEPPRKIKSSLSESWERTVKECALGNCKTFALIENMLMPKSVHEEYEQGLTEFLSSVCPDHLGCYYYGHNNEHPEEVHNITMKIIKEYYLKNKQQHKNPGINSWIKGGCHEKRTETRKKEYNGFYTH
jgi:hypothetical protein